MITKRKLGRTECEASILSLGGIPITGTDDDISDRIINEVLDSGINLLETSHAYGKGKSETKFGRILKHRRSECFVHSRALVKTREEMEKDIDESLRCLQTDFIDIYGIHDINWEGGRHEGFFDEQIEVLNKARDKGKIRFLAVSGHRKDDLITAIKTNLFDVVMVAVNPLDLDIANAVLPVARELDMGSIAMKPFAGGLFTERPDISLRYALAQDLTTVSVGVKSMEEIEQNLQIAREFQPLTDGENEKLLSEAAEVLRSLGKHVCRQCGYCLRDDGCAQNIDIPRIFELERQAKRYFAPVRAKSEYAGLPVKADTCTECAVCETRCPYKLPIHQRLKEIHQFLSSE